VKQYLLRRLAFGVSTLFGVSVIIFVVMRILPGDPLVAMFGMEGFSKLTPRTASGSSPSSGSATRSPCSTGGG